jgi:atrial natriuretic peptide receptor A
VLLLHSSFIQLYRGFHFFKLQLSDLSGFAELLASAPTPFVTIEIINALHALFDQIIASFDVYKVQTLNDKYLVIVVQKHFYKIHFALEENWSTRTHLGDLQLVSGLPVRNGIGHASQMAKLALALRTEVGQFSFHGKYARLQLRVGMSSGKREKVHKLFEKQNGDF